MCGHVTGHVLTLRAETWTAWMSPPNSSQTMSWASSSCLTLTASACGRSHLLMATITGTEIKHGQLAPPLAPPPALPLAPPHTFGPLGVLDGLHRLVHDAVVRRHHEDDDVGEAGPPGPHGGEGGVAGRVQERDLLT